MTDDQADKVEYHERRKREEWAKALVATDERARRAHRDLAKLHDLARVFPDFRSDIKPLGG